MNEDTNMKSSKTKVLHAVLKNCHRLNVRAGNSATASVVGVLSDSDRIKIDGNSKDREWITVLEPIFGFAKREFLEVK